nr:MAG: RNA-dependent RNA-polymerase [Picobirnavirus sp.]
MEVNMKIIFKQFSAELDDLRCHNNSFRQSLNRLEHGSASTPRTWFYETKSPEWILETLQNRLDGMKDLRNIADWDLGKSPKFAYQGRSAPLVDRLDLLDEYFEHLSSPLLIKDPIWKKAKLEAIRRLKFNESGSPYTSEQVVARGLKENKLNTSSGFPLWRKRNSGEAIAEAIADESIAIKKRFPYVLGVRASMGKIGTEARSIFMAPMALNVHGQRFLYPVQDYIRSLNMDFFAPWEGWDEQQTLISNLWTTDVLKFGTDYSKMDQHFNKYHAAEVYDVVKHFFSKKWWNELEQSIQYIFVAPIITNLGLIDQEHSMPSGSEWTNFLETVWDYIQTIYLELKYHLKFRMRSGIGDDQLLLVEGITTKRGRQWLLDTIIEVFEAGGTPGNKDKQEEGFNDTTFLQRYLSNDWRGYDGQHRATGVYSLIRNATSQVFPEFYHNEDAWGWEQFALRAIQIGENTWGHPEFHWYVSEFMARANENILRFVRQTDSKIREDVKNSRKIANFLPTYNQAKIDKPIFEYEVFKLLREIA